MLVAASVIAHVAALGELSDKLHANGKVLAVIIGTEAAKLDGVHRLSYIAAAAVCDMLDHAVFKHQLSAKLLRHKLKGTSDRRLNIIRLDGLELKHSAAADYRIVHIKVRVLGRRGNERYAPVLDELKKRLLLFFIQILYLVEVKKNAVDAAERLGLCDYLLDIGYRRRCSVELVQLHIGASCN